MDSSPRNGMERPGMQPTNQDVASVLEARYDVNLIIRFPTLEFRVTEETCILRCFCLIVVNPERQQLYYQMPISVPFLFSTH